MHRSSILLCIASVACWLCVAVVDGVDHSRRLDVPITECLNNGELKEGSCECTLDYEGRMCEHRKCKNFGRFSGGRCHCPAGYTGPRCAGVSSCMNDGKLVDGVCECGEAFTGARCEVAPCEHGTPLKTPPVAGGKKRHSTEDSFDDFVCICQKGYMGVFCNEVKACQHGGYLSEKNECVCNDLWEGELCEVCNHATINGACVQPSEKSQAHPATLPFNNWLILVIAVSATFVLLVLAVAVFLMCRSRSKPSRVPSSQGSAIVNATNDGTDV